MGLGRLPRLPPPTCARPVSGAGLGPSLLPGFTAVVSRPPPVASFSLCALRLFVIKRTYTAHVLGPRPSPVFRSATSARVPLVVWAWDFLLCDFLAAVSRPLLAHCFSICDLRLFANKRMLLTHLR